MGTPLPPAGGDRGGSGACGPGPEARGGDGLRSAGAGGAVVGGQSRLKIREFSLRPREGRTRIREFSYGPREGRLRIREGAAFPPRREARKGGSRGLKRWYPHLLEALRELFAAPG